MLENSTEKYRMFFYDFDGEYHENQFDTLADAEKALHLVQLYHHVQCAGTMVSWHRSDDDFGSDSRSYYFDMQGNIVRSSQVRFENGQCVLERDKDLM